MTENIEKNTEVLDYRLAAVVPSNRQVVWQKMEFYSLVCFGINTFTGREWGTGTESEKIFNPTAFDASQWVDSVKAAGMKGMILTCKHHDGFCLWPSRYTRHSVAESSFREGKGDVVREVADACRKGGIRFGIYLSPWDRNSPLYGQGKAYDDYFVNQLTELLTGYGEICSVWFDGACGEGPNGKKQIYDWERYYEVIRRLQPDACIHVCGPDVRWCGNEAGDTRPSEWSVVPKRTSETERIASKSQQADETGFRERKISADDQDLGSRSLLVDEPELIWYPAEVDTSIRPGWFYHKEEDEQVRSLNELLDIYYRSVGGNTGLLLSIPPTKEGLFHENDVKRLRQIGEYLRKTFAKNLLEGATLKADTWKEGYEIEQVRQDDYDGCFRTEDGVRTAEITITFPEPKKVSHVVLKENIRMSQRIENFEVVAMDLKSGEENAVGCGTVVGYKRIIRFPEIRTNSLTIRITDSRVCPTLSFIGVY